MNSEVVKQEIQNMLERMGFGEDIESINVHEGTTSRFSVKVKGGTVSTPEDEEEKDTKEDFTDDDHSWFRHPPSNMLIGERGSSLSALEYLLKRILSKKYQESFRFTLDINDYRIKGLEGLKQDVKSAAKEVRLYKKEVPLRPMSSFERRIVHLLLAEYPDITTESIGREPDRRVVIRPYP